MSLEDIIRAARLLDLEELRELDRWIHNRVQDLEDLEEIPVKAGGVVAVVESWDDLEGALDLLREEDSR